MNKIEKAKVIAEKEIRKISEDFVIRSVLDLGDNWLFNWSPKKGNASDNHSIEVKKDTLKSSVFVLPNKENFKKLKGAKRVSYAKGRDRKPR